jgi:hypothetical protein
MFSGTLALVSVGYLAYHRLSQVAARAVERWLSIFAAMWISKRFGSIPFLTLASPSPRDISFSFL